MSIYVIIVAILVGVAVFQVLYTRSHRRRLEEHERRMDETYGTRRPTSIDEVVETDGPDVGKPKPPWR
jgi:predicted Holliday junction resolvase-like endonuclease